MINVSGSCTSTDLALGEPTLSLGDLASNEVQWDMPRDCACPGPGGQLRLLRPRALWGQVRAHGAGPGRAAGAKSRGHQALCGPGSRARADGRCLGAADPSPGHHAGGVGLQPSPLGLCSVCHACRFWK